MKESLVLGSLNILSVIGASVSGVLYVGSMSATALESKYACYIASRIATGLTESIYDLLCYIAEKIISKQ